MTAMNSEVEEALARLCNAECMLSIAIAAHDETIVNSEEWRLNEALHGIARLLDGVYSTLCDATSGRAESAAQ